ncbi:hypothetical protein GQ54DRAFT_299370 [Martensiomyces pterosporus]|nr:hypothetical protein GQ54DRAFT_299370 [Martensiomyces pterosporus]
MVLSTYEPGTLCWAKLKGYPWWPSRVSALRCVASLASIRMHCTGSIGMGHLRFSRAIESAQFAKLHSFDVLR